MPRKDTTDFLAAFAVGTVLGIGATLLLRGEPAVGERVAKQLTPRGRKLRRSAAKVAEAASDGAGAAGDFTGELVDAGRELLSEFRKEVQQILEEARDEVREAVRDRVASSPNKGVRKTGRAAER